MDKTFWLHLPDTTGQFQYLVFSFEGRFPESLTDDLFGNFCWVSRANFLAGIQASTQALPFFNRHGTDTHLHLWFFSLPIEKELVCVSCIYILIKLVFQFLTFRLWLGLIIFLFNKRFCCFIFVDGKQTYWLLSSTSSNYGFWAHSKRVLHI